MNNLTAEAKSNPLEEARKKIGLSRKDVAIFLGTSVGAVSNYEYGTRLPKPSICHKYMDLAASYGIDLKFEDFYPRERT